MSPRTRLFVRALRSFIGSRIAAHETHAAIVAEIRRLRQNGYSFARQEIMRVYSR